MALLIAGLALGGPLVGMMLVSLGGHSYMHLLPEYAPLPLSLAILSVGGTAVGLALLPSFFFWRRLWLRPTQLLALSRGEHRVGLGHRSGPGPGTSL